MRPNNNWQWRDRTSYENDNSGQTKLSRIIHKRLPYFHYLSSWAILLFRCFRRKHAIKNRVSILPHATTQMSATIRNIDSQNFVINRTRKRVVEEPNAQLFCLRGTTAKWDYEDMHSNFFLPKTRHECKWGMTWEKGFPTWKYKY
jgi:hypothetical protein